MPRLQRLPLATFLPRKWRAGITIVVAVTAFAYAWWQQARPPAHPVQVPGPAPQTQTSQTPPPQTPTATTPTATTPTTPASASSPLVILNQTIRGEDDRIIYRGDVDLAPSLARIAAGTRDDHVNDGAFYRNFERRLPAQRDRDYYREFVVPTPGHRGVGPQRLVLGARGEAYYTPDHYQTFRKLNVMIPPSERP